jgi:hypothetical protein
MTNKEEKSLKFLKNLSSQLDRHNYHEAKIWLQQLVPVLPISIMTEKMLWRHKEDIWYRDPHELYRARENELKLPSASLKYPFKTIAEVSHVPYEKRDLIKNYGRCNLPGQAIFYCSNYYPTACIECLTNGFVKDNSEAKSVTMSTWRINEPLILAEVIFSKSKLSELKHLNKERYEEQLKHTDEWYKHNIDQMEKEISKSMSIDYAKELLEFFSDEFGKIEITSDREYILSNYYCDCIFNQTYMSDGVTQIDGIIYPSVKYSYQEHNIALHPRAMRKISFNSASQVWVTYSSYANDVQFVPMETAYSTENDQIDWKQWNPHF